MAFVERLTRGYSNPRSFSDSISISSLTSPALRWSKRKIYSGPKCESDGATVNCLNDGVYGHTLYPNSLRHNNRTCSLSLLRRGREHAGFA